MQKLSTFIRHSACILGSALLISVCATASAAPKIQAMATNAVQYDVGTTSPGFWIELFCGGGGYERQVVDRNGTNQCHQDWHKCTEMVNRHHGTVRGWAYARYSALAGVCTQGPFYYKAPY